MNSISRFTWVRFLTLLALVSILGACASNANQAPTAAPPPQATTTPLPATAVTEAKPTSTVSAAQIPATDAQLPAGILYQEDFADPTSGWPNAVTFGNYFIGYHEPSYYHVDVHVPHDRALVALPKRQFTDITMETKVLTEPNNTAASGDFRYGLFFRRTGSQYYAFTISPRTQTWALLKASPEGILVLKKGTQPSIQGLKNPDLLRVDIKGTLFYLHINDQLIDQVSDADYPSGDVGFYVESFDSPRVHAHYDTLTIREVSIPPAEKDVYYQDDFTDPTSGWPNAVAYDNYFIGYHEPSYFHVDVHVPHDRALVALPKKTFTDLTMESKILTEPNNTAAAGDFRYGLFFRRSGNQYYAFTISPRTQTWSLLKVSPDGTQEMQKGSQASIQGLKSADLLRVDLSGANFYLHINDQLVGQANDASYTTGEVGFYVETFDIPRVHVHYDTLAVRAADIPQLTCSVTTDRLNQRLSPSKDANILYTAARNEKFEPIARSRDGTWIQARFDQKFQLGWIFNSSEFFTCTVPLDALPVRLP